MKACLGALPLRESAREHCIYWTRYVYSRSLVLWSRWKRHLILFFLFFCKRRASLFFFLYLRVFLIADQRGREEKESALFASTVVRCAGKKNCIKLYFKQCNWRSLFFFHLFFVRSFASLLYLRNNTILLCGTIFSRLLFNKRKEKRFQKQKLSSFSSSLPFHFSCLPKRVLYYFITRLCNREKWREKTITMGKNLKREM